MARRDRPIMHKFFEEVFNRIPGFLEYVVVRAEFLAVRFRLYDRLDICCLQSVERSRAGIISPVGQQNTGFVFADQNIGTVPTADLCRRQLKTQRIARNIARYVNSGAQSVR